MNRRRIIVALWSAVLALGVIGSARSARAVTIQDMVRLQGQGQTVLQGQGLVIGVQGTGDSGQNPLIARMLAQLMKTNGVDSAELAEFAKAKNVAVVTVTCTIPQEGGKAGDRFDCFVQATLSSQSLAGGRLFITPLSGPLPGQGVYAFAEGPLVFEGQATTSARVKLGAQLAQDIDMPVIGPGGTIMLTIKPQYAGWPTAKLIANTVEQDRKGFSDSGLEIARALDAKSVVVWIPEAERLEPANFIGDVLSIQIDPTLLNLPARVVVNEQRGTIVVSGNVQISPGAIAHRDLVVTTITPPRVPTDRAPLVEESSWTGMATGDDERSEARLQDLLEALKQLDVSVNDQIAILAQMHAQGLLHAEFIRE